ncbi:MAG: biotin--[acetyl-CoA-carboxylase] ligase [Opitutaceae bacterium]|nr:biotin--[acetyl-CoA-carboxylase] ligase [Opitutaceae bacterium]
MRTNVDAPVPTSTSPLAEGWSLHELDSVDSTNRRAAPLPAWSAVTARTQTAGRGRHDRRWVSDTGGLWLSAVLPTTGEFERWSLLPLAAGLGVCQALTSFGLAGHRLRWPNDIMIGPTKLAGLLVERFRPATAVVGIGINYDNRPEADDPGLTGTVARLTDLLHVAPARHVLRDAVLTALRHAHRLLAADRAADLVEQLSPYWRRLPVRVTLRPDGAQLDGHFAGVDPAGRLLLKTDHGSPRSLAPHEVELLRELSSTDTDRP